MGSNPTLSANRLEVAHAMAVDCPHVADIRPVPDGGDVCPTCIEIGSTWINLRQCLVCGHVGCCDSSLNMHATRHRERSGHPIVRSIMPGQDWIWCYVCELQSQPLGDGYENRTA